MFPWQQTNWMRIPDSENTVFWIGFIKEELYVSHNLSSNPVNVLIGKCSFNTPWLDITIWHWGNQASKNFKGIPTKFFSYRIFHSIINKFKRYSAYFIQGRICKAHLTVNWLWSLTGYMAIWGSKGKPSFKSLLNLVMKFHTFSLLNTSPVNLPLSSLHAEATAMLQS